MSVESGEYQREQQLTSLGLRCVACLIYAISALLDGLDALLFRATIVDLPWFTHSKLWFWWFSIGKSCALFMCSSPPSPQTPNPGLDSPLDLAPCLCRSLEWLCSWDHIMGSFYHRFYHWFYHILPLNHVILDDSTIDFTIYILPLINCGDHVILMWSCVFFVPRLHGSSPWSWTRLWPAPKRRPQLRFLRGLAIPGPAVSRLRAAGEKRSKVQGLEKCHGFLAAKVTTTPTSIDITWSTARIEKWSLQRFEFHRE